MKKAFLLGIVLSLIAINSKAEIKYYPNSSVNKGKIQGERKNKKGGTQGKIQEENEVIIKIKPITPPKPIVNKEEDEFEKQLGNLKRQFRLLEYKLKIEKIKTEMEKLQAEKIRLQSPPMPIVNQQQTVTQAEDNSRKEEIKYREKLLRLKLQQQKEKMEQLKLSYLQNLFTGVMEINGKKVAFDSFGRRYTVGSSVEGFVITGIDSDGVKVASPYSQTTYKIPIASGIEQPKKKTQNEFIQSPPEETAPPPIESEPLPVE